MARPKKQTVEYFPHMVNHKKTMFILESEFGNDGYAFWFKLLETLGGTDGHSFRYENPEDKMFLLAKTRIDEETAEKILDLLSKLGAIDRELWENGIIWSDNFIENVKDAYKKRTTRLPEKPVIAPKTTLISEFSERKLHDTEVLGDGNPQSKVNESKVNNTKQKDIDISLQIKNLRDRFSASQLKIVDEFFSILKHTRASAKIGETVILKIYQSWEKHSADKVICGLRKYIDNPSLHDKKENYVLGIIRNLKANEVKAGVNSGGANEDNTNVLNRPFDPARDLF